MPHLDESSGMDECFHFVNGPGEWVLRPCTLEAHQAAPAVRSAASRPPQAIGARRSICFRGARTVAPRASAPQRDSVQIACDRDLGVRVHAGFGAESDVAIREHLDSSRGREICLRLKPSGRGGG